MLGVPEGERQQIRHWLDLSLHRERGRHGADAGGHAGDARHGRLLLRAVGREAGHPADDMLSRLTQVRVERDGRGETGLDDARSPGSPPCSAARAPRRSPSWSATRWCCSRGTRTSGGRSATTVGTSPAPSRRSSATSRPRSTRAGSRSRTASSRAERSPPGSRCCSSPGRRREIPRAFDHPTVRHRSRAERGDRLGHGVHSCLGAALPGWRAASPSRSWPPVGRLEVDEAGLAGAHVERRRLLEGPGPRSLTH